MKPNQLLEVNRPNSAGKDMKRFCDEVLMRFPEAASFVSEWNQDLPYVVVGAVVDWLRSLQTDHTGSALIQRLIEFRNWCFDQSRGSDASDDILTMYYAGFFEELFRDDSTGDPDERGAAFGHRERSRMGFDHQASVM